MYRSIVQKITENTKQYPDRIAIADPAAGSAFTYGELDAYARKLAAKLVRAGVSRGDFVTIELGRCKEYIAAMYASWLTGAAFALLSSGYPAERLAYIRSDCRAKAVINDEFIRDIENEALFEGDAAFEPTDAALLIYTSGSTGKPKGVLLSQESVKQAAMRYMGDHKVPENSRFALGSPFSFVASSQTITVCLSHGWTAYIVPQETMRDPVLLADFIDDNEITLTFISPKMLKVLKPKGDSLVLVHTGGERVSRVQSDRFKIIVGYGQTESAGGVLLFEVDKKYDNTPIGKTVGGVKAYILDENGCEAEEGELCLAGVFADCYLNMPEQSEKTFIDNPFMDRDGFDKLLRTGDIVKMNEDGNIVYLNRKDWMVKINGQRVEPGEIETVIKNTDGIFDAAVKDFKNSYGQVYLAAYYVEKEPVDAQTLRARLAEKLPHYMIPAFVIRLDKLPVNVNGKLDRSALPEPEAGSFKNEYAAPETQIQRVLCAAFEEMLGIKNIGVDDDFFALGGDSIKTAMLARRCEDLKLSAAAVFEGRTPRAIERILKSASEETQIVKKEKKENVFPLTPSERGMYLEQKLSEASTSYNLDLTVAVKGSDAETVKRALNEIFAAHEAFRSCYGERDGVPVRIVTDKLPEIVEKSAKSAEEAAAIIDGCSDPFDLTSGIPVRPTVYVIDGGDIIVHLQIHHIAFDGGSAKPFMDEFFARLKGEHIEAAPIDLSDLGGMRDTQKGMEFYREMFADGVPVNDMPVKGTRPKVHPVSDKIFTFDIDSDSLKSLGSTAQRYGVTSFELVFSAVSMTLGKYTASQDVVIGIPTDMRERGAENVIGMFVNTAPVRVKPIRDAELDEFISSASSLVRAATRSSSLPFEDIVAEFVRTRDESRNPIFDVSVNYLRGLPVYEDGGLSAEFGSRLQKMTRDIGIVIHHGENGMRFNLQYSSELFDDEVIAGFASQLRYTLGLLSREDVTTVRGATALPQAQLDKLEAFSNEAYADVPVPLLHKLFEKSAAENALKTALIAKDKTLTYKELDESANTAANALIEKGVKKGDSVVLLLPRESCFFSCMFGVNKAGAAFIPCDPQYPADRIRSIIEDSGASFIITTKDKLGDYPADKTIDAADLLSGDNTCAPDIEMTGDELSYMIYTSGSTGKPKGVMLRHRGICSYLMPHPANTHIHYLKNNIENYLSVTTVSFDMSFKEHTAALCNGKTLIFAAQDEMNDPRALAELMEKYGVDCINATPSRLQQYMEYAPFRDMLAKCRLVMSGGEGYPMSLRDAIKACSSDIRIINTYGPTEITVSCNAADLTNASCVTVGRPLLNYKEYIVDGFGDLAPCGVVGELYVGGVGVAKGYRNLPEKTAEAFVEYNGMRMYRTGDYAKFDESGNVHILGRLDSQVKLRGLRIELSEIEELIAAQPDIKKAAVIIRSIGGQDNLCAYFTADVQIDIDALRDELKKHLTHYMVPAAFMQLDEMPVTANGKTDTKSLPEPTVAAQRKTLPQNDVQQRIFDIACGVLGNDDLGIETELYSAGLTSLNSVGFCIKLSDAFGVNVQIRDLHDNDTVEKLEKLISALSAESSEEFEIHDEYAVTKIQEGIFFETESHPDSTIYNIPTLLLLGEGVDMKRLKTAVCAAVNAHPYLLTRIFIDKKGEIRQKRCDETFDENEIEELRCASIDDIKDTLVKPFDLQNDRLCRFKLIETGSGNYLFFDIHHIVFDGESKKILLRDIGDAYAGKELTPEKYSGFEAALAEEKLRAGAHYDASKEYYTKLFDGIESDCFPISDILSDDTPESSGTLSVTGKAGAAAAVRDYCAKNSVSENAYYTAVFGWLLGRYCGRDDAVFTTVNNGRNDPRFKDSVSMFVRTYPVLSQLENTDISDYIKQIGKQLSDSLSYDVYSFAEMSRDLGIAADVLFVYQSTMTDSRSFEFCGEKAESIMLELDEEKAKIELLVYPDGDSVIYHCSYAPDMYTEGFIKDIISVYERALEEFSRRSTTDEVILVDEETRAEIERLNRLEDDYEVTDMVTMFRRRAEASPDNIAVVYLDHTYTYKEVDRITENIAAFLKDKGIHDNQAVSVLIPRCEYMPIAAIGILKSGAGYQPLDPSYPPERLEFMIRDADAKYLIADRSLMDKIPNYSGPVLYTDEIPSLPDAQKITEAPDPNDLFIMLYTSGSTGVPKGVQLLHHNLCCYCSWYIKTYEMDETSRASAYASYGFDAHMLDMYPVLLSGGQLHIIDESIRLDLIAIRDYFRENKITHTFMTTQVGRQYADLFPDEEYPHHLSVGGEKLVPIEPPKGFRFYNGYGPTECTIFTHMYPMDKLYKRVPIGRPLSNMKQYIVDKNLNLLPFGIPGELIVAGHQVGLGYLNRPEQSAKAFIRNPFSDEEGYEHAYRTGDIVRILRDGTADIIGRNDGQVKVRGFRIELSEVEGIIRKFPGIKDATVQAFDETGGGKFVAAYVVSDKPVDIDALGEFIKKDKPAYMVPAVTMQIDRIPLNQNQKVNKRALPVPEKKAEDTVPVQNETQQRIFDCISNVIGTTAFGITTDIFDAGLNSIGAIKLNVMLSDAFGVPVTIKDLRSHSTVQSLETFFSQSGAAQTYELQPDYPITQTQNGIFVECVANPDSTVYNIPYLFKLSETVDTEKLKSAAEAMINAHPYLKTELFLNDSGDIRARRNDSSQPVVELTDIDKLPENMVQPFELMNSRLYRVKIYRTKSGNYLYLEFHHIICDGTSEVVMIEDINAAYEGKALETEKFTGFEAALKEEEARQSDSYAKAKAYYDSIFSGADPDFLPARDVNGEEKASNQFRIPSSIEASFVKSFCEKQGVTLNAFFNAVFAFVLAKYNYKTEAVYTTIYNGRNDSRLARSVTMLVKTFPVYCALDGDTTISELIKATGEQLIGSMENDIYSFAEISRAYDIPADVMFAYQGEGFAFGTIGGARAEMIPLALSDAKAPLNINVSLRKGRVVFACDYRSDRYSEAFMRGFVECMEKTVTEFTVKNKLKEVSLLGDKARKLIEGFNATEVEIPHTTCNRLFEEQAAKNPDKTAVIAAGESFTYTQLNENANRVAHSLIDGGVTVDEMVGVMMPRTIYAYAAREGILKAGAAFMPLAPDYPDDRVSYILENSGAKHVVTTAELAEARKALFETAGVSVHVMEDMLQSSRTDNPDTGVKPENLCYCIYTSGSTGKPKGVMIEHHSLVNFVDHNPINVQSCEFVDNMTVSLALAALTFDVSVLEESLGLYHGGTVAMATDEEINNPFLLAEMIERNGVDVMKCTPSYMNNMLDVPQVARALRRMKAIDIGAEAFPAPLYDKMRRAGITAKIHNGYGPTEATITTSIDPLTSNFITIGKPLCNTKVVMLDKYDNELPPDVPGELTILGECVGRGYVANEKLNKEKFITFNGLPAYRSGDLARRARDGKILFMGRMDNQVKLRGLRIELDEIENVMNSYPSVTRSVVIVKESETMGQFLCAYFAAGVKVDSEALTAHLAKSLAKYMIPSVFIQLDAIPLTANGKVDKKALPEPELEAEQREYIAPTTEMQKKLCDMFAYALGTDKVSVTDNFFEIGGTSLTASKIAMKAMMEKLPIAFKDIFDHPTVLAMEKFLSGKLDSAPAAEKAKTEAENTALSHNTSEFVAEAGKTKDIGNVLLTGATGFLGIHVLKYLIDHTDKTVYCLLRGNSRSVDTRLRNLLMYYFDDPMEALFGSRIITARGDITDIDSIFELKDKDFLTVINCAACVKHFVQDDTLDRINWHGVENLVEFCLKTDRRLVHVSTVSVAGTGTTDKFAPDRKIHENELYIGQTLDNKYANTKFKAEQVILKAVLDDGLDGTIVRVGNLMSRYSDGEFQINFVTNNFMRSMRAYARLGMIPVSALDAPVEFSPIDCTAQAVVTLAATDRQFTVFHATNGHRVQMGDVAEAMNRIGITLRTVDDETFKKAFDEALSDESMSEILSPLISYKGSAGEAAHFWIGHDNSFTTKALYRLGFKWPIINEDYLANAFEALDTLDFFSGE